MNKAILIGNLTKDPETRVTQGGKNVTTFTLAVNRRGDGADYFRVSAWDKLGATCQQYLAKGRKAYVSGPVSARTYQGQDGKTYVSLEVTANEVEFLSPRERSDPQTGYTQVETEQLPF